MIAIATANITCHAMCMTSRLSFRRLPRVTLHRIDIRHRGVANGHEPSSK